MVQTEFGGKKSSTFQGLFEDQNHFFKDILIIITIIVFIQAKDKNTFPKLQWKIIKRYMIKYNSNVR